MSKIKQVIIWRKDLNCRTGKKMAQAAHSSLAFLTDRIRENPNTLAKDLFTTEEREWVEGNFAKICLQVGSEHELMEIAHKAKIAGLTVSVITDAGLTEFNGIPTKTCICLGPHESEKIDKFTSHLSLY